MGRDRMRKYVMLIIFTVTAAVWILTIPKLKDVGAVTASAIKVQYSHISSDVTCSGTIEAANKQSFVYGYPVKVDKLYVKIGDKVTAGQKIADIDKKSTYAAMQTLASSAALGDTSGTDNSIPSPSGAYTSDESVSGTDTSSADTTNTDTSADTDTSGLDSSAAIAAASQNYNSIVSKYAGSNINGESVSNALKTGSSVSQNDSGDVENTVPDSIYAGISGTVTDICNVDGSFTQAQTPVAVIMDMNTLQVKAQVDENEMPGIKTGQKVRITGPSFSTYKLGRINQIYPVAASSLSETGARKTTVTVVIGIGADDEAMPGLSADVDISTNENDKAVMLPYTAVDEDSSNCKYVYLYSNGMAVKRYVSTGREYKNSIEITKGVTLNDLVITSPSAIKANAQKVRLRSVKGN